MGGIEIKGLTVAYGDKRIFDGLDAAFPENEISVVLGSSGVGKTTLLNAIAGLVPYGGEIRKPEGGISYIFQKDRLIPGISVYKNLDLVLRASVKDRRVRRGMIEEMLAELEIEDQIGKYPSELSGGQAQRVSMARAFLYPSSVLLMDEPFRALDAGLKLRLLSALDSLLEKSPRTVVYVTHDADECMLAADSWRVLSGCPAGIAAEGRIAVPRAERDLAEEGLAARRGRLFALLTDRDVRNAGRE